MQGMLRQLHGMTCAMLHGMLHGMHHTMDCVCWMACCIGWWCMACCMTTYCAISESAKGHESAMSSDAASQALWQQMLMPSLPPSPPLEITATALNAEG